MLLCDVSYPYTSIDVAFGKFEKYEIPYDDTGLIALPEAMRTDVTRLLYSFEP